MARLIRRELVITVITSVSILVLVSVGFVAVRGFPHPRPVASPSPDSHLVALTSPLGLTVRHDPALVASNQATALTAAGTLWELRPPAGATPFVITADYEQGDSIKKLVAGSKKSPRDAMADNLNRQLPQDYPGYKLVSKRNLSQAGSDGLELQFTYTSEGQTVRQRLLLLLKNDSAAAYIRAQALTSDFDALDTKYFEPILTSARYQ